MVFIPRGKFLVSCLQFQNNISTFNMSSLTSLNYINYTTPEKRNSRNLKKGKRVVVLSKPPKRRLEELWNEKGQRLPSKYSNNIKGALEADYFMSPKHTENYFKQLSLDDFGRKKSSSNALIPHRKQWMSEFSSQVARHVCEWVMENRDFAFAEQKENEKLNLKTVADTILEKVALVLGQPKPRRKDRSRIARFMIAISDRIAVWVEDVVTGVKEKDFDIEE